VPLFLSVFVLFLGREFFSELLIITEAMQILCITGPGKPFLKYEFSLFTGVNALQLLLFIFYVSGKSFGLFSIKTLSNQQPGKRKLIYQCWLKVFGNNLADICFQRYWVTTSPLLVTLLQKVNKQVLYIIFDQKE
jgi:hypothetical protein